MQNFSFKKKKNTWLNHQVEELFPAGGGDGKASCHEPNTQCLVNLQRVASERLDWIKEFKNKEAVRADDSLLVKKLSTALFIYLYKH